MRHSWSEWKTEKTKTWRYCVRCKLREEVRHGAGKRGGELVVYVNKIDGVKQEFAKAPRCTA